MMMKAVFWWRKPELAGTRIQLPVSGLQFKACGLRPMWTRLSAFTCLVKVAQQLLRKDLASTVPPLIPSLLNTGGDTAGVIYSTGTTPPTPAPSP